MLVVKKVLTGADISRGKEILLGVVSMLVGLIKAIAPDRVYEDAGDYVTKLPEEQVKVKEQDKTTAHD